MLESDLDQIILIEDEVHIAPWNKNQFAHCLQSGNHAWVIETPEKQIGGYAIFSSGGGEAELLNVAVSMACQRQGFAEQLIEFGLQALQSVAENCFLEVRESNYPAQGLYEKLGFGEVGRRPKYYPKSKRCPAGEDALIYALAMDHSI